MRRILIIILLAFNGIGAVYGGILLIADPEGWKLGIPTSVLKHSPFDDFLIPGIILFLVLGLGSLLSCALVILNTRRYPFWVILMGFILSVWISIQMLMLRDIHLLQILYAIIGLSLMILGILERKQEIDS